MEKFADKIRKPAVEASEDEAGEAEESCVTAAVIQTLEECWTKACNKEWGCWTPLGKASSPAEIIIKSHAEYVAVCEFRFKRQLTEQQKRERKSKIIEGRFKTLSKKVLGRKASKQ